MVEHRRPLPDIVMSLMGAALGEHLGKHRSTLVAQMIKNPTTMQETRVWSLSPEDRLEKEMATHSSVPVWEIPGTKEPGRLQSKRLQMVRYYWVTNTFTFTLEKTPA